MTREKIIIMTLPMGIVNIYKILGKKYTDNELYVRLTDVVERYVMTAQDLINNFMNYNEETFIRDLILEVFNTDITEEDIHLIAAYTPIIIENIVNELILSDVYNKLLMVDGVNTVGITISVYNGLLNKYENIKY